VQSMARLAEDWFTTAALGQFKRGKRSLLNAIVGRNLFADGNTPSHYRNDERPTKR
jgi:hypothetical protein